jgi:hypothetical protein
VPKSVEERLGTGKADDLRSVLKEANECLVGGASIHSGEYSTAKCHFYDLVDRLSDSDDYVCSSAAGTLDDLNATEAIEDVEVAVKRGGDTFARSRLESALRSLEEVAAREIRLSEQRKANEARDVTLLMFLLFVVEIG